MSELAERAREFLAQRRIAVAGVSRDPQQTANYIFRRLRDSGHEVFPVNPNAREVEGVPCYPDLRSVPAPVDGVLLAAHPDAALDLVKQCDELGIRRVWMHRAIGPGSASAPAVRYCAEHGIALIDRGCPVMFCRPVDPFHRCMRWFMGMG